MSQRSELHLSNVTPIDGGEIVVFWVVIGVVVVVVINVVADKLAVVVAVGGLMMLGFTSTTFGSMVILDGWGNVALETVAVSVVAACCSMVRGGRFGTIRSGSGHVGALPYWKVDWSSVGVSSHLSPLPVEPTRVTALRLDGDDGALGIKVSTLPEVETDAFDGTPKNPWSCGSCAGFSLTSSTSVPWTIVTGLISTVVVSGIHDSPIGSRSVVDCCW